MDKLKFMHVIRVVSCFLLLASVQFVYGFSAVEPDWDAAEMKSNFQIKLTKLWRANKTTRPQGLTRQLARTSTNFSLTAANTTQLDAAQRHERRQATLIVGAIFHAGEGEQQRIHSATAAGFVIDKKGIAVTNYQVLKKYLNQDSMALGVADVQGNVYPILQILAASEADDIVIFRFYTQGKRFPVFPLAPAAVVGRDIYVISHPQQKYFTLTNGQITRRYIKEHNGAERLGVSADFDTDSSGGPVFDSTGNIVGVVTNTYPAHVGDESDQSLQEIIPVAKIRALLE